MDVKILEVRDEGTMFGVLCVNMNPSEVFNGVDGVARQEAQHYQLRRVGYPCDGRPNIAITHLSANGRPVWNDPYGWKDRTYAVAHKYIIENWASLQDGDVIDVQFILGERPTKKISERFEPYGG